VPEGAWSIWLITRVVSGTLLSAAMLIGGMLFATWVSGVWPGLKLPLILGGAALYAGGLYMFVGTVANRLFPQADRALCGLIEWLSGGLFAGLLVASIVAAGLAGR